MTNKLKKVSRKEWSEAQLADYSSVDENARAPHYDTYLKTGKMVYRDG